MFVGKVNQDLRSVIAEITEHWRTQRVRIGCSGNFIIERLLAGNRFSLSGNDVSLYSCAIGNWLANKDMVIWVNDSDYSWLEGCLEPGPGRVATLLLATTMLQGYRKTEPYWTRQNAAYRAQWVRLHEQTMNKVRRAFDGLRLSDFWPGDVVDWIERAPEEEGIVAYPPTYAGGYEKLYRAMDSVFGWQPPSYRVFDDERMRELSETLAARPYWILIHDAPVETLGNYLVARVAGRSIRSLPTWVYASRACPRLMLSHQKVRPPELRRMNVDSLIGPGSRLSLIRITGEEMNALRSLYLNPKILPATAMLNFAVLVDGAMAVTAPRVHMLGEAYMLSDFAVRPTRYRRLSKLVVATALSRELQCAVEQAIGKRMRFIGTTAFTDKPESMKYRGIFELHDRKPGRLNYTGAAGRWTLEGALEWWLRKHAQIGNSEGPNSG